MGWVLRLVETGTDSRARSVDVMEISRPNDLGVIANLGLTLPEAKQLLARVQQAYSLPVSPAHHECFVHVTSRQVTMDLERRAFAFRSGFEEADLSRARIEPEPRRGTLPLRRARGPRAGRGRQRGSVAEDRASANLLRDVVSDE
jgi:hypothetical protein